MTGYSGFLGDRCLIDLSAGSSPSATWPLLHTERALLSRLSPSRPYSSDLLQEQLVHADLQSSDALDAINRSGYQPQQDQYNGGANGYLDAIAELKGLRRCPIKRAIRTAIGPNRDPAESICAVGLG